MGSKGLYNACIEQRYKILLCSNTKICKCIALTVLELKFLRLLVPSINYTIFKLKKTQQLLASTRSLRKFSAKPCVLAGIKTSRLIVKVGHQQNLNRIGSDQLL